MVVGLVSGPGEIIKRGITVLVGLLAYFRSDVDAKLSCAEL